MEHVVDAITYFVVFLFSTTLHEAAHAWAALRGGDRTAYHGGQVTLDPRPHIDRFGTVVLPGLLLLVLAVGGGLLPFAYAKPAPLDPRHLKHGSRDVVLVSTAGPAATTSLMNREPHTSASENSIDATKSVRLRSSIIG